MKHERGCRKPGESFAQRGLPFRFSAPVLQETREDWLMEECPVGYTLREAPWVYQCLSLLSGADNSSVNELGQMPRFMVEALTLQRVAQARAIDDSRRQGQAQSDAAYGAAVRSGQ